MSLRLLLLKKMKKIERRMTRMCRVTRVVRMTRVVRTTRVVKIIPRGILWITIQFLYIFCILYSYDWIWISRTKPIYMERYSHIYIVGLCTCVLQCVCCIFFMKCMLSANPRYNSHMHRLMNFDFLEYD